MKIRDYKPSQDFPEICRWSRIQLGVEPKPEQFSPTSFVAEIDNKMVGVLCVLLTNSKHYCIPECLVTNIEMPATVRMEAIRMLNDYAEVFARAMGYKGMFCLAPTKALSRRFKKLGYVPTLDKVTTMYKELEGRA